MKVWDALVRGLHWTLVATVALAWLSTETLLSWHEPVGYVALAAVALRVAWGFGGSRYARFGQFVRGPAATLRYARAWTSANEPRYIGHNPLGAWMVVMLLALVAAVGFTGWLFTTDRFWGLAWLEELHRMLAWGLLGAIGLHVGGVIVTSQRHRESLVLAMVTGRKRAPRDDDVG